MKSHMMTHIGSTQVTMFTQATNTVKGELTAMCESTKKTMLERADQVFDSMRRDYMTLIGVEVEKGRVMSREERAMRAEVDAVISQADERFQAVIDCDAEDLAAGIDEETGEVV
jgi:ribosome-associated toxin RatA of RatAB toxin-antitoxin module